MPIYEYECNTCHNRFERRQSVAEQPVQTCPDCAGPVRRVYHPVGIVFKGSGFYSTDYRKDKVTPTTSPESKSSSTEEGKPAVTGDGQKEPAAAASSTTSSAPASSTTSTTSSSS